MRIGFFLCLTVLLTFSTCNDPGKTGNQTIQDAQSEMIEISQDVLLDKVRGGLLGQIIGNLNGIPYEFKFNDEPGNVADYVPALPDGAYTDDDTDIEWVYVYHMQEQDCLYLSSDKLAEIWKASFNERIWCSNGYVRRLLDIGIKPPLTGKIALNPWAEFNISGQFICETFGLICPAMPQSAAKLGLNYTKVTIDAEPAQATQLYTTMIATAFVEDDIYKILEAGYSALDPESKIRIIIDDVKKWFEEYPEDWRMTRKLLKEKYTQANGTMRDGNGYELITGATIASFLYGQGDFIRTIQTGFNFGWDCDNTTATLGTILGIVMGYKKMMAQGWKITDRYKNTTRDGMPGDETITSFADRVFELMEKMILDNGGKKIKKQNQYYFQIPVEQPMTVEQLPLLDDQISELAIDLKPEITGILADDQSGKEDVCRAVYLGICLNLDEELSESNPDVWENAKSVYSECWKLNQLIFYNGEFPSIKKIQEKFLTAGIEKPTQPIDLQVIWQESRICLPPDQLATLEDQ